MIAPVLLALALAAKPWVAKPEPTPLMPNGPWYVRGEENMCLLERRYTLGDRTVSLVFQPLLDLPTMEVFVIDPKSSGRQYQGDFAATVAPAGTPFAGRYFSVSSDKGKARVTRLSVERQLLEGLKDGDRLHVRAKPLDQTFTMVRPEKARVALQSCIDGLKKEWGIDPEIAGRGVTPLEGNPARYFGPSTYPPEALRSGIYGRVIAFLNIDASGGVGKCRILSSAGQALNEGTCKAAARIRFKPARDKDGNGLPSTYLLPVRWVLPGSPDF